MSNTTNIKMFNDPGWGSNDDQNQGKNGPPDLDKILGDWTNAMKRYVKGHKSSNHEDQGEQPPKSPKSPLRGADFLMKPVYAIGILVVILAIWIASGFFTVKEGQVGVITQFGSYTKTVNPGFQWHIPYPIQKVEIVNVEAVRSFSVGYRENALNKVLPEALMLTEDENIVDLQFDVQYRLKRDLNESNGYSAAANYLFRGVNPDESVRQAAETAMREIVGKQEMNKILYESRTKAAQDVRVLIQTILDRYYAGIEVITVAIQNVQPPEQVQAAFEDAIKAGQDNERQKNEGHAYASKVVPEAKGRAFRMVQEAHGYHARVVGAAKGQTARFNSVLNEYKKSPKIMRDRLYLEAMDHVFSKSSKVLVDSETKPFIYLPKHQTSAGSPVEAAAGAQVQSTVRTTTTSTVIQPNTRTETDYSRSLRQSGQGE
ncbi:MAG: FtsH protease activity modulator HflK [Alcaligenaceae bacterium]|nr:FtsH protease activity modulator HflK [Alcaligenaceae bacterium]